MRERSLVPILWLAFLVGMAVFPSRAGEAPAAAPFFFKDGDRVVVIGDSITVQGDYGRYLENFVRTRFPDWKLQFRNAGINGHTAQLGMPWMESDVFSWKPTVAIVNWGMNDGRRKDGVGYYKAGIVPYVEALLARKLRVVLCSNTPLDLGDEPGKYTQYNREFHEMAVFAEGFARERGLAFVDQFHFCHGLWGENRRRPDPVPVSDQTLAKHASDFVHARAAGQLTMAHVILKTLGAPAEVSHASIDAASGQAATRRCRIEGFARHGQGIAFTRVDEASPCWIDDLGAKGFALVPFQEELNRTTLEVNALPPGSYELVIEGKACGRFSAEQLARGIDLAADRQSPVHRIGRKVDALVLDLKGRTQTLRDGVRFQPPEWLKIPDLESQRQKEMGRVLPELERLDGALAEASRPVPLRIELKPVASP